MELRHKSYLEETKLIFGAKLNCSIALPMQGIPSAIAHALLIESYRSLEKSKASLAKWCMERKELEMGF